MHHHVRRALTLALIIGTCLGTASAYATQVTVRVVGDGVSADPVGVNTNGTPVNGDCAGHTAGEALDLATSGNWDKQAFVSSILGESHAYAANDYWAFWVNGSYSQIGHCAYTVQPGDELLYYVQRDGPGFQGTVFPLYLANVPTAATAGQSFTVTVREHRSDGTTTSPTPIAGATVSDGQGSSATTDVNGVATLTVATPGNVTLRATRTGSVVSPARTVRIDPPPVAGGGGGGGGGGAAPAEPVAPASPAPAPAPAPAQPDTAAPVTAPADTAPPVARLAGLREGSVFSARRAPRLLRGRAADDRGLAHVKLRIVRRSGRRCSYFSGGAETFRPVRCGRNGSWFSIGREADWSYLLPERLRAGGYTLAVKSVDLAGRTSPVDLVRFRVR